MHPVWFPLCLLFFQGPVADPPTPTLVSVEPSSVVQGTTVAITFKGSGFVARQTGPEMPAAGTGGSLGVAVAGATQYTDENTMTVLWSVMAPAGRYYVDMRTSSPPYVSPKRSNLLPFTILPSGTSSTPEYEVTTFAGKPGGLGAIDGRREAARFQFPRGIWGDGRFLYVSDNQTMRRVEISTGVVTTIAGEAYIANYADGNGSEARLNSPGPVWGDGTNLYVLEPSSGGSDSTLRKIALTTGEVTTVGARGQFAAFDVSGSGRYLYFTQGRTIWGFDPDSGQRVFTAALEQVDFPMNTPIGSYSYGNGPIPLWSDDQAVYVVDNGSNDPQKPRSLIRRIDLTTHEITTIAGSASQVGYVDSAGAFALFNRPSGLWGDGAYLYVVDNGNRVIRKISLATRQVSTLTGFPEPPAFADAGPAIIDGPASVARFAQPGRIWGDGTYLYVTDLSAIRRVTIATGEVLTIAGSPRVTGADDGIGSAARFVNAGTITGTRNVLYVLDGQRGALRRINMRNAEVQTIGYIAPARYRQAIWADETNIYTVDTDTGLIQTFELSTGRIRPVASLPTLGVSPVFYYRSIWGDGNNLYIGGNKKIYKVVIATGEVSVFAGMGLVTGAREEFLPTDGIGEAAQFVSPTALWSDGTNLYVADTRLVRKMTLATREVTSIAGDPMSVGISDGIGANAGFGDIRGISGDSQYLYVTEISSPRVRRIAIDSGEVTTLAGELGKPGSEDGIGSDARFTAPAGIWSDGKIVFVSDVTTIRQLAPVSAPASTSNFALSSNGSALTATRGRAPQTTVGYAKVRLQTAATIAGTAIFSYRSKGVLVTEAGVPATPPLQRGRIYTASAPFVRTGVAMANPNAETVTVSFSYTDENGVDFGAGRTVIPANGQVARFLDEAPFNTATVGRSRTFTFTASAPVGVIALRGFTNERSEFLITTLPVTDLSAPPTRVSFPHFAEGGNWTTSVALVNPSDAVAEGDLVFLLDDGTIDRTTSYSIPPRSAFTARMPATTGSTLTGQIRVDPKAATPFRLVYWCFPISPMESP